MQIDQKLYTIYTDSDTNFKGISLLYAFLNSLLTKVKLHTRIHWEKELSQSFLLLDWTTTLNKTFQTIHCMANWELPLK